MIKRIEIKSFRNIKNKVYACDKKVITINGNNRVGKTNTLNAIYWCLTGCDLNGSVDNALNIPYGEEQASVKLVLDNGTIERTVTNKDYKTVVKINDKEFGSRTVENEIDNLLGISELAKKDTTKFKARRFLLNPSYYQSITPGEFRKWIISIYFDEDEQEIIKKSKLSELTKFLVLGGKSLSSMSTDVSSKIKSLKAEIDKNKTIQEFLQGKCITAYNEELAESTKKSKLELLKNQELSVAIEEAALEVSKYYNDRAKDIVLLEKGKDDDVWKEVCYPKPFNPNLPFSTGSTAESILISLMFINRIEESTKTNLPKLIDEGETLDRKSLEYLQQVSNSQLFITKVAFETQEGVEID